MPYASFITVRETLYSQLPRVNIADWPTAGSHLFPAIVFQPWPDHSAEHPFLSPCFIIQFKLAYRAVSGLNTCYSPSIVAKMADPVSIIWKVISALTILYILEKVRDSVTYRLKTRQLKCGDLAKYPHKEPIWGIDFVLSMTGAFKEHRWLVWMDETWAKVHAKTFRARFLGMRMVYSSEMENMKAMSTTQWQEFILEPIRVDNGAAAPFTGKGVSTADGDFWQHSRNMIKPYFDRSAFANVDRLRPFTEKMLACIPTNGDAVDMQVLMRRWVCLFHHDPIASVLM